jgi:hypothetical protein
VTGWDVVGDAGVFDLAFGAHQALGHGGQRYQECCGDFAGGQAAQGVQGQRDLLILRQGRVAAGKDQFQPLVGNIIVLSSVRVGRQHGFDFLRVDGYRAVAAQAVDGFAAGSGCEPGARVIGDSLALPMLDSGQEGVLQGFFGQLEIPQPADQSRQDLAVLLAVNTFDKVKGGFVQSTAQPGLLVQPPGTQRLRQTGDSLT